MPRSYVNNLESRIDWLEALVREKLPGVKLDSTSHIDYSAPVSLGREGEAALPVSAQRWTQDDSVRYDASTRNISDQIGFVSITAGADLRYLGPSSGLFFTRYVLAGLAKKIPIEVPQAGSADDDDFVVPDDLLAVLPKGLPPNMRQARWLSQAYFDVVHPQFPFLHEPTYLVALRKFYEDEDVSPPQEFQVFLVLAIGAIILSRRAKTLLGPEGYYASAMKCLDDVVKSSSLETIQCILLIEMYTLNNPSSGLSLWPLHYQALAVLIETGSHRIYPRGTHTALQDYMRPRVFWCVYTIDRMLSTLMGRPMGVADEQCDLALPQDTSELDTPTNSTDSPMSHPETSLTQLGSAIHLFRAARLTSEIKSVLYCVDRNFPPYTRSMVEDLAGWRDNILGRLEQWRTGIPLHPNRSPWHHMNILCNIKYHELIMLILRPNPRLQQPSSTSLGRCFTSAIDCCNLYHQLYVSNSLHYGWMSVHSLFMCVITLYYCVWTPPGITEDADIDALMRALKASSDILSAMGEYWPEATRSRDVLSCVSTATLRRFLSNPNKGSTSLGSHSTSSQTVSSFAHLGSQPTPIGLATRGQSLNEPTQPTAGSEPEPGIFALDNWNHDDAFMSTNFLTYFLGNGADAELLDGMSLDPLSHVGIDGSAQGLYGNGFWAEGH